MLMAGGYFVGSEVTPVLRIVQNCHFGEFLERAIFVTSLLLPVSVALC